MGMRMKEKVILCWEANPGSLAVFRVHDQETFDCVLLIT